MSWIFQYSDIQECGLQPFQGDRNIRDRVEYDFCV